jgi:hypothetical protein
MVSVSGGIENLQKTRDRRWELFFLPSFKNWVTISAAQEIRNISRDVAINFALGTTHGSRKILWV